MILPPEHGTNEKRLVLEAAGWTRDISYDLWQAPNCMLRQDIHAAYQGYLIGKRCEEPLVKKHSM